MGLTISPETETRLIEEARRLGISVDALLDRLIDQRGGRVGQQSGAGELPVWHLGARGPFHRRDIYEDGD